jgi:glyoxylase-like metal-dependent hydrolase (beta-lactamase superfamily II)
VLSGLRGEYWQKFTNKITARILDKKSKCKKKFQVSLLQRTRDDVTQEIKCIEFPMRIVGIKIGTVNCYLIKTEIGYILIDSGFPRNRADLEKELKTAECRPGNLKLIVMTHGDGDHSGNGAFLREKYGARIAIHSDESGVVENGDSALSRSKPSFLRRVFNRMVLSLLSPLMRSGKFETFSPDFTIDEGYDFSEFGFNAKVLYLPGHSKGSIGILTNNGDLFCGDLLTNMRRPSVNSMADNQSELKASVERLKNMRIKTVYPGHGKPFSVDSLK